MPLMTFKERATTTFTMANSASCRHAASGTIRSNPNSNPTTIARRATIVRPRRTREGIGRGARTLLDHAQIGRQLAFGSTPARLVGRRALRSAVGGGRRVGLGTSALARSARSLACAALDGRELRLRLLARLALSLVRLLHLQRDLGGYVVGPDHAAAVFTHQRVDRAPRKAAPERRPVERE